MEIKKIDNETIEITNITKSLKKKINLEDEKEMLEKEITNIQKRIVDINNMLNLFK